MYIVQTYQKLKGVCNTLKLYPENSYRLTDPAVIRRYILGGNGVVTLKSPSGVHHTYLFKKPKNPSDFPDDIIFVYAVHDGNKLFYVGMVEAGVFRLTRSSRFLNDTPIVKGARFIMKMSTRYVNTEMVLYHEGMCSVCGRLLTSPKSIENGIGPRCMKRGSKHNAI